MQVDTLETLTYSHFLLNYLIPNRPLCISAHLIQGLWPASILWVNQNSGVNWNYLSATYGSLLVSVTDCTAHQPCISEMIFKDVIQQWRSDHPKILYVKDWHLARWVAAQAHLLPFYATPSLFADDWLNYHYSNFTNDDFRFVYIGIQGTSTPFHKDVYDSYSWSTNIIGKKLWTFWMPDDADRQHPGIEVIQDQSETIFVPSGWYHTVQNLTACISINHNWCNSINLPSMYNAICRRVSDVEKALEDVKQLLSSNTHTRAETEPTWENEWMNIVQDVLEKDAGWNWSTFWQMVLHGLDAAIRSQESTPTATLFTPAPQYLQPPFAIVKRNVRYCFDEFRKRQQEELKGELDLKLKYDRETGEADLITLSDVVARIGERLEE